MCEYCGCEDGFQSVKVILLSGSVVVSPHHPKTARSLVVESGEGRLGQWAEERRNVVEDYRRAFGKNPPERVKMISLFTDNDQTGKPVDAYYGAIRAIRE